jgi:hypothetical protein
MKNTRPPRVFTVPPNPSSLLDEIEKIINPTTPEAKQAVAQFVRDERARIANAIYANASGRSHRKPNDEA